MRGFAVGSSQIKFGPVETKLREIVSAAKFTACECKVCQVVNNRSAVSTKRHLHDLSSHHPLRGSSWPNPFKFALLYKPVTVRQPIRYRVSIASTAKSIGLVSR